MSELKFKPSAVLRLKSGGPLLSILGARTSASDGYNYYECQWFTAKNKLQTATFREEALNETFPKKIEIL